MPPSVSMTMTTMRRSISATNISATSISAASISATSINATVYYDQPQEGPPSDHDYEYMAPAPNIWIILSCIIMHVIAYDL